MIYYLGQRLVDFSLTPSPVNFIDTEVHVMEIVEDFQNYEDDAVSFVNKRTVQWRIQDFHRVCVNPTRGAPTYYLQWRIQNFPGGTNSQRGCANLLFCKFLAENCIKMKEFGPQGRGALLWCSPLDPPMI